jgi:DNA uptake protein ComE-like DNA-binding protein
MVLVVVLVVIAIISLAAGTFCELMLCEREAAQLTARQAQARALADSGIDMARSFLSWEEQARIDVGGWYNNAQRFQGTLVIDDATAYQRGRFSLVAPQLEDGYFSGIRFGLESESARLNLNALAQAAAADEEAGRQTLMGLPGMTEDIADAILDWIDSDDDTREFGAESDYYQVLDPPYTCRNGLLASIEELLLVRGVTPALLYGVDANRNGYAESSEPDPLSLTEVDNSDGTLDRGWAAYLTLYSVERNVRPDGTPKIDVNQDDMQQLYDELVEALGQDEATFIVAYRQFGPSQSTTRSGQGSVNLDFSRPGNETISTVLDLIGAKVEVQVEGSQQPAVLDSPFPDVPGLAIEPVTALCENVTAQPSELIPGRININEAPRVILEGIPGMSGEAVDQILGVREPDAVEADPRRRNEVWLWSEGIISLEEMKAMAPYITGGGSVYRAQAIGYFDEGGPAARIEVVLDATTSPARVVSWNDISHLGPGYPKEMLGIEMTQ